MEKKNRDQLQKNCRYINNSLLLYFQARRVHYAHREVYITHIGILNSILARRIIKSKIISYFHGS